MQQRSEAIVDIRIYKAGRWFIFRGKDGLMLGVDLIGEGRDVDAVAEYVALVLANERYQGNPKEIVSFTLVEVPYEVESVASLTEEEQELFWLAFERRYQIHQHRFCK